MTGMHVTKNRCRRTSTDPADSSVMLVAVITVDLGLIEASFNSSNGDDQELALDRIGVGEHLMLAITSI
ncbi:hypothetical protein O9993_08580 [Vibrio lentus]|nr:hypothetical protein [Vibrio lentus]